MDTELKEKVTPKIKLNSQATKEAKKRRFSQNLPSLRVVFKVGLCVLAVYGACNIAYNMHEYFKNKAMISEHAEQCSKNPSYENCSAPIVDASKAGKNAVGIVDGVGRQSLKQ